MINDDKNTEENKISYAICTDLKIAGEDFTAVLVSQPEAGVKLRAAWDNSSGGSLSLNKLAAHIDVSLPDFLNMEISVDSVRLEYAFKDNGVAFSVIFNKDKEITLSTFLENDKRCYSLTMKTAILFPFAGIPVLGGMMSNGDGLEISEIIAEKNSHGAITCKIKIALTINNAVKTMTFNISSGSDANSVSSEEAKWVDINQSLKVVTIHRLGVIFKDGIITILVDSSFSVSVLTLDFYELYISTAIPPAMDKFSFGLSGLMVSFKKSPLTLSGGLYRNQSNPNCPMLYDGEIQVGFSKFLLTALGSYGELESGEKSLFIYLMLSYPLGGPPFFFVTGLAAGFGVNRKFMIPELKDVKEFPLVSAARNPNSEASSNTKPAVVLSSLSKHLVPSPGDYFVTVGVAFKSFNMLNSFALLTVAFGNNLNINLLGISDMSLPPNVTDNPVAYAQLVLKAVYDHNEGSFKIDAMLTEESYLFDKNCKLTGGFAFYIWGKGAHKGDFAVTLGGFAHPAFTKPAHYPAVDKLGINWKISNNLSLSGYAYFGLTPSCLMAGGGLKIQYQSGRLSAWLTATVDMLIKWKPFYYDVRIYISLGASYRGILATYSLHASADLHIWGPNFSGKVHIEWFIISFTIKFGADAKKPPSLNWKDFNDSFMPKELPSQTGAVTLSSNSETCKAKLLSVRVCGGIIGELKEQNTILVNASELLLETRCEIPCKTLYFNNAASPAYEAATTLGVVPMGITHLSSVHRVKITYHSNGNENVTENYIVKPVLENISSALWLNREPDINDKVIKDIPTGLSISLKEADVSSDRLPVSGRYSLKVLENHEAISKEFSWSKEKPAQNDFKGKDVFTEIKSSMPKNERRAGLLAEMAAYFGTYEKVNIKNIGVSPRNFFLGQFAACRTGAINK